ncbi:MAG: phosphoribosyltransferase family protein [Nanoarchaeota archaeon]
MTELVKLLREADIVVRGNVRLRGREESTAYFDVKKAYGDPKLLKKIGEAIAEKINKNSTCVVGKGYGGISLATTVSLVKNIPLAIVRDSPQKHGLRKWIEGYIPKKDDLVAIVDDVFTTGGSIRETAEVIQNHGARVNEAYVVIKRGDVKMQFPVHYLVDSKELL